MSIFSERLKELRIQKKLTQKELAESIGETQGKFTKWENGTLKPSYQKLTALASKLDTSTDYLLGKVDYEDWIYSSLIAFERETEDNETDAQKIIRDIKFEFEYWLEKIVREQSHSSVENNPLENRIAYLEEVKQVVNDELNLKEESNFFDNKLNIAIQEWKKFLYPNGNNSETTHSKSDKTDDNEKY